MPQARFILGMHAGQMAEALARGFIDKGVVKAADVHCTDPVQARREVFESFGAQSQSSTVDVSSAVFLSVLQPSATCIAFPMCVRLGRAASAASQLLKDLHRLKCDCKSERL